MTSPVLVPKEPRRRRSSLKRQRLYVIIALCVVALLAVAFAITYHFTSRTVFPDADGTKYYIVEKSVGYVMQDEDGNELPMNEDKTYYITKLGTIVMVDPYSGEATVVAAVIPVGSEALEFQSYKGAFDILLYPMLERSQIESIRLVNKKGDFTITYNEEKDDFEIVGYEGYDYSDISFSSLVVATGYTNTHMRLDLEKVKLYGYAEYGLPDDPDDAEHYFVITDRSGNVHKVILGNKIPSGAGYYARHADREEVYILKETESTTYSKSFTEVIFGGVEYFVQPLIVTPMTSTNYFDVLDFQINNVKPITDEMLNDPNFDGSNLMSNIITFDFTPIELRKGTLDTSAPYKGKGAYEGFPISSLMVDECLHNLMNVEAAEVIKIFDEEKAKIGLYEFFKFCQEKKVDVSFSLGYTSVLSRDAESNYAPKETAPQQLWVSKVTANGTYYVYNDAFSMIVEVGREHFEYLEWTAFDWVESDLFRSGIAYLQSMTVIVPGYQGVNGLDKDTYRFEFDNSESLKQESAAQSALPPTSKLLVWESGNKMDTLRVKTFYETLLRSSISGLAGCTEAEQAAFREAARSEGYSKGDVKPFLVVKLEYSMLPDGSGGTETRTYCFYKYGGGSQCFLAYNGLGSFYMLQDRVEKIIADLGRVFTGETITPTGKF